jgi:spermidine dehydrogenase
MSARDDRALGMGRRMSRRDFLDGVAVALGGAAALGRSPAAAAAAYPPALEGLRGQYAGSYAIAHQLRDGTFWTQGRAGPTPTGERYDLVVVGGGLSGLAAAYFYRERRPGARVLVLETLDDFGGHAKRNEFRVGSRMLLSNGGAQSLESPGDYRGAAARLLGDLGLDYTNFYRYYDAHRYDGLGTGVFFERPAFPAERLVTGMGSRPWREFLAETPLSGAARRDIERIYTEAVDYLPHLDPAAKRAKLTRTSYAKFLVEIAGCDPGVLPFFKRWTNDLFALEIEAVAAAEVFDAGDDYGLIVFPGFAGMDLGGGARAERVRAEPYIFHYPDGNASLARMLVRRLVPEAVGGDTMEDVVTARARYDALDRAENGVRIRLGSTVVRARNDERARDVEIAYARGGELASVRATHCVLACWNTVVPYVCPDVPAPQREALAYGVKAPLVYTHVAIRNWEAFARLGVRGIHAPGSYHSLTMLDFPVDIGAYRSPKTPAEPMVLWMLRTPCRPGLAARDQYRAGRAELYATSYRDIERETRSQLQRMLGGHGFDAARDIVGLTVNRWAHGYAYEYLALWDPPWAPGASPAERGRRAVGRIGIANSDSAATAYSDAAINEGYRAVDDVLTT